MSSLSGSAFAAGGPAPYPLGTRPKENRQCSAAVSDALVVCEATTCWLSVIP